MQPTLLCCDYPAALVVACNDACLVALFTQALQKAFKPASVKRKQVREHGHMHLR
jgi:hypothetical protein